MTNFFDEEVEFEDVVDIPNVITNTKSDIQTVYNNFVLNEEVKIFTDGIPDETKGVVIKILEKTSKFINNYLLYQVKFKDENDKVLIEWFYNNELYPLDAIITRKKRKKNYINNRDMVRALLSWQEERKNDIRTPLPVYICECFVKIAENLAHQSYNHTEISDMKSSAVLTCMLYAHNFDIEESTNAFAYFTRYVKNAFAQVHNTNKKFIDMKFNLVKEAENADTYNYRDRSENEE